MILTVCPNPSIDTFWTFKSLEKGTSNRSSKETFFPGGKGIHVALALNELGEEVTVLGTWGGASGKWLKNQCLKYNIQTIGPEVEGWSRLCITNKSSTDWNETELLGSGPKLSKKQVNKFKNIFESYLINKNPKAVVLSGSVPRGFNNNIYYDLINISKKLNVPAYVDASGKLLESTLKAKPFVVHINRHEGKDLSNENNPAYITRWLSDHCSIAAVTAGRDGLFLGYEDEIFHAYHSIDPSEITSTVGAGDCLLAGLCMMILNDKSPLNWAKFATACGSANCINPNLGMLKRKDANKFYQEVTLECL